MDKRRMEVTTSAPGISNNFIDVEFDNGIAINIHGYRAMIALEPEDADANCNGGIAIWVLPGGVIQNNDLPITYAGFGNEDFAPYLWGMIPFAASNQTPFHWEFTPKTSRNMQRGGRIVMQVRVEGVSAGNVRINTMQTCFVSALK